MRDPDEMNMDQFETDVEPAPRSTMKDHLIREIRAVADEGMAIKDLINTAKTQYKKKFYQKKLKKNSTYAAELIAYLEMTIKRDQAEEQANESED